MEYRLQNRGGKGIKTCNITDKNGSLVTMKVVNGEEDIMVITTGGVLIRMAVSDISTMGRNTQGVKLIRLDGDDEEEFVATVATVEKEEEESSDLKEDEGEENSEMNQQDEARMSDEDRQVEDIQKGRKTIDEE